MIEITVIGTPGPTNYGLSVFPCTLRKANDFIEVYHRHSVRTSRDGGKFAIGVRSDDRVVGVAIVGNPVSASLMDGFTAEVLRACVLPESPRNCNSLLYGACRRVWFAMGGAKIITYTLTEESGVSLRASGWVMAAEIRGHDVKTWGKRDHLKRQEQLVYAKAKRRWESVNKKVLPVAVAWPEKVDGIRLGGLFDDRT